ncbi:MAG: gamma-glutamyltransferase [Hyphomicrobiaceae bacterium]
MRNFHFPGRSPVIARNAMCATSHPLASLAAIEMLKSGGNAVDAAITATAMLCVVEPAMTGIGGDCFALIAKPGMAAPIALNASGRAPQAATAEWYAKAGITSIPMQSPHAVTVPGAIDGWARLLEDHGTRSFADVLAPAIEQADRGYVVAPRIAADWAGLTDKLKASAGAAQHLLPGGRAPRAGEIVRVQALAETLKRIADKGRAGFYEGPVAEDIVAELKTLGGLHTMDDFARQACSYVDPISVSYKGVDVFELPPNNQGVVALVLLKMLNRFGRLGDGPDTVERYHVMMEAVRLAYAMRDTFVADPEFADVPIDHMLSDAFADELVSRIDRGRRKDDLGPIPVPGGTDTTYLTVVDKDGMAVSFINSIFSGFGSGIMTRKTGVLLQNRGQGFVLDPKHPNCIEPGKRPMHTLVPAMAMKDGKTWASFGVMGGNLQPAGHAYVLANLLDYGLDPQEALDSPRVFFEHGTCWAEQSVPESVYDGLVKLGHPMQRRPEPWGGGQIVRTDHAAGTLTGASDPRKDGCALGY